MSSVAELIPLVGLLIPAAISPGPNNSIVLHAAVQRGLPASLLLVIAIIMGSIALLSMSLVGLEIATQNTQSIRLLIALCGAGYLTWMGFTLFHSTAAHTQSELPNSALPSTFTGVLIFQLVNPKAWLMMGIVSAHWSQSTHWSILLLTIISVFGACLTFWAIAGRVISRHVTKPYHQVVFNKTMGLSLIFFASLMLFQNLVQQRGIL